MLLNENHDRLRELLESSSVETREVAWAKIYAADTVEEAGKLAGYFMLHHLLSHWEELILWCFARAPSQVAAWHTIAQWWPNEWRGHNILLAPFDEIRGSQYLKLENDEFRSRLPRGFLPNALLLKPGDCSQKYLEQHVATLNADIKPWVREDVFSIALAGTSPNASLEEIQAPGYDPSKYEFHLAFDRPGLAFQQQAYKAIPMSVPASTQQQREQVVDSADSLASDHVVTMSAWFLGTQTEAMVLAIPDNRGINLWRMLNEPPSTEVPGTLIQQHAGMERDTDDFGIGYLVACTTKASLREYDAAKSHYEKTGRILGV
ncbi:MAG: hypothetical protein KDD69_06690 [Bdellovibrionales bacterium]|nr:hypothetical protein [Bdellovibrionales bacterium]